MRKVCIIAYLLTCLTDVYLAVWHSLSITSDIDYLWIILYTYLAWYFGREFITELKIVRGVK